MFYLFYLTCLLCMYNIFCLFYLVCLLCRSSMFCLFTWCVCGVGPVCSVRLLDVFMV